MFGKKPEIRFIGDLQRLTIGPDDRFVLTCEQRLSIEAVERIKAEWAKFAGQDDKLCVFDGGAHLGAINVKVQHIPDCAVVGERAAALLRVPS
jgi:hypothetical protein